MANLGTSLAVGADALSTVRRGMHAVGQVGAGRVGSSLGRPINRHRDRRDSGFDAGWWDKASSGPARQGVAGHGDARRGLLVARDGQEAVACDLINACEMTA